MLKKLQRVNPKIETLSQATLEMIDTLKAEIPEEDYLCAKYVVEERDRVLRVSDALSGGDYATVGLMMYETHRGLSEDYKVS